MSNIKYVSYFLENGAQRPIRFHNGDAGWDLFTSEECDIAPGETADVHTGVHIVMPSRMYARITGRSSSLHTHHVLVNEAIIDNGYTGEFFICVHNLGNEVFHVKRGMRLAQVLFHRMEDIRWCQIDEIPEKPGERGNHGFGSTGA